MAKNSFSKKAMRCGMIFLTFPSACNQLFSAFNCRSIDAGMDAHGIPVTWSKLEADLSIDCEDSAHAAFQIYAAVMIFV